MARTDDKKEFSSNVLHGSEPNKDGDPLLNFLASVVHANAGLSQSPAANAGAKVDQMRRLEEILNAQIGDLRKSQRQNDSTPGGHKKQLSNLHAEILSFTERLNWLESAAQQTHQMRESLRSEMDSLQIQLSERQTRDAVIGSLEETIISQLQELQNLQKAGRARTESVHGDAANFRAEMRDCADRIDQLESVYQQTRQSGEHLRAEMAALQAQVSQKHGEIDARHSAVGRREANVTARIEKFEHDIREFRQAFDSSHENLIQLQSLLRELGARVGQVEMTSEEATATGRADRQCFEETAVRLTAELADLKERLGEQERTLQPLKSDLATIADRVRAEVHELRQRTDEKSELVERHGGELKDLGAHVQSTAQRLEALEPLSQRVQDLAARAASTEEQLKQFHGTLIEQLGEVSRQQTSAQEAFDNQWQALEQFRGTVAAVTERMTNIEAAAEDAKQSKESFQTEFNTLRTELSEHQQSFQTAGAITREADEQLRMKVAEISDRLAQVQNERESGEAQLKDYLTAELVAVRNQIHEWHELSESRQSHSLGFEESVTSRVRSLEDQLKEDLQGVADGNGALAQCRSEMSALVERLTHLESAVKQGQETADGQTHRVELMNAEINATLAGLRAELDQQRVDRQWAEGIMRTTEEALTGRIQELQKRVEETFNHGNHQNESVTALTAGLQSVTAKLTDLEPVTHELKALANRDVELDQGIKSVRESLTGKISGLEGRLSEELQTLAGETGALAPLKSELETLTTRLAQMQATAEQALSLAGGNARAIADGMAGLKAEIEAFKANSGAQTPTGTSVGSLIRDLEDTLNQRLQKLESQIGQKLHVVGSRDLELSALKAEVQALTGRIAEVAMTIQSANKGAVGSADAMPLDRSQSDTAAMQPPETMGVTRQPTNTSLLENAAQVKQLQDRMSAEIERVRAELREKSGRWKVRR